MAKWLRGLHIALVCLRDVHLEKRGSVHHVFGVKVAEKLVNNAVGENGDTGRSSVEVVRELPISGGRVQWVAYFFAFHKHYRRTLSKDGEIHLLSSPRRVVGSELWDDFLRVEHVVTESLQHRQDKGDLGGFLRCQIAALGFGSGRNVLNGAS